MNKIFEDTNKLDEAFKNAGRNDDCLCGSGKKFKKCHLREIESALADNVTADYKTRKKLILSAGEFPVYKCSIGKDWKTHGLARVIVARTQPNSRLVYASFLVDIFCLGVKNTFCNAEMPIKEFEETFVTTNYFDTEIQIINLDFAKTIIYGSIAYAKDLGFDPNPDFDLASHLLGDNNFRMNKKIKFGGPNGIPFYITGPDDNSFRIVAKLEQRLGKDGFEVLDLVKKYYF